MSKPIVSVIVPTKNSQQTLEECLKSVRAQTYKSIEIIVVDNFSTDRTPAISKKYADVFLQKGPERSAQVNYGVTMAKGRYIYKIDSDFILEVDVIAQCMKKISEGYEAVVVHNSPDTTVSWVAKIRKFEVDMYKYDLDHSSARFVKKSVFEKIGGFNATVTAGEDYDFQNKLNRAAIKTAFVESEALHLGEPLRMRTHLVKYYAYGKDFVNYKSATTKEESGVQLGFVRRVYLKNWRKFLRHPLRGLLFVIYHTLKYVFGSIGLLVGTLSHKK